MASVDGGSSLSDQASTVPGSESMGKDYLISMRWVSFLEQTRSAGGLTNPTTEYRVSKERKLAIIKTLQGSTIEESGLRGIPGVRLVG